LPGRATAWASVSFVGLTAALMATNALAIDSMLPALPQMAEALGIVEANHRQWIVTAYLLGFGVAQIFYGTISDRYGRRPVLLVGLSIYVVASIAAAFSGSFEAMMAARVVQGIGAAATRVLVGLDRARLLFRPRNGARDVARHDRLPRRADPGTLDRPGDPLGRALALDLWRADQLRRHRDALGGAQAARDPAPGGSQADRVSQRARRLPDDADDAASRVGYMLAMAFVLGGLFGFINSAQQVFVDVFHAPELFTTIFALIAMFMAASSLLNSRIVVRLGMRRVSHGALLGYIALTSIHALVALAGHESLWSFAILQGGAMFCFGLIGPEFRRDGDGAARPCRRHGLLGTGLRHHRGGALLGFYIGQHFNGTVVPLTLGFSLCGIAALVTVLIVERGRLFHPAPGRS
jgi:DHA1 family bicyclomycin/chloramphenicol resistance-like MFS transporter